MSLIQALLGNASEMNPELAKKELEGILLHDEIVENTFKLWRDMIVFTPKRLIFVNKQGFSGKKISYQSVPWRNIARFSAENAGTWDLESELKIYVRGAELPVTMTFAKGEKIFAIQQEIARRVLGE